MQWSARTEKLISHPDYLSVICQIGHGFVVAYGQSPKASSMFASQQRWLMSHIAMKLHFRGLASAESGLTRHNFLQAVLKHELASRNTTQAILAEALKYGLVRARSPDGGTARSVGRDTPIEMSEAGLGLLTQWFAVHLQALDALGGAPRLPAFLSDPSAALLAMEPFVCDELLACMDVRQPAPAYAMFTWMDQGGLLMDRLMMGIDPETAASQERSATDVTSMSELAREFGMSRSHVARKLVDGERAGHIGWTGRRGYSAMWVSSGFRGDYGLAQALKLVIIDAAFAAAFPSPSAS